MSAATKKSRVTSKGQVTIPKSLRDSAGLKPGKSVTFELDARRRVVVVPAGKQPESVFEKWRGRLKGGMTTDETLAIARGD